MVKGNMVKGSKQRTAQKATQQQQDRTKLAPRMHGRRILEPIGETGINERNNSAALTLSTADVAREARDKVLV